MNICIRQIGVTCLWCVLSYSTANAQAGFNAKIGMETWSLKDESEMSGHSQHPGQMIGFDVFVEDNRFLFVPGFQYHRISLENEDQSFNFDFSEHHHAHYLMIPLSAGYKLIDESLIGLSALGGAEVVFFYAADENDVGLKENDFYGVSVNLAAMVQVELFSFLTADVNYHYGLMPILKTRDDSKLRGWTLGLGVKF